MEIWGLKNRDVKAGLLALTGSENKVQARKAEKVLELVRYLEDRPPFHRVFGILHLTDQLSLVYGRERNRVSVRIWMDWPDSGPIEDGAPIMHFRADLRNSDHEVRSEIRTRGLEEIRQFLLQAFD